MGYGRDISRFSERKRVVKDKNIGPLVSTDMTRCIHCTRCVRFGAGDPGLSRSSAPPAAASTCGSTPTSSRAWITSCPRNIIDLCPVGALNNKPFRYHARAWEMTQHALVSPHDGFGTNIYAHVLRGRLMRMVPRENEEINETWIADRDRFGFEGMYSPERVTAAHGAHRRRAAAGRLGSGAHRGGGRAAEGGAAHGAREPRVSRLAERHRGGDVSARADCARPRQQQHRSPPASAGFPRAASARPRIPESGPEDRRRRDAGRRARGRLEPAARDADAGASHPQGRACKGARRSRSSIRAGSSTCSRSPPTAVAEDLVGELRGRGARRGRGGDKAGAGGRARRGGRTMRIARSPRR